MQQAVLPTLMRSANGDMMPRLLYPGLHAFATNVSGYNKQFEVGTNTSISSVCRALLAKRTSFPTWA